MKRIAPVARKRSLTEARKGERAEWLRLSPRGTLAGGGGDAARLVPRPKPPL